MTTPFVARVGDLTAHPGAITGPGVPNVLINGLPIAVVGDIHTCAIPPPTSHPPTPFLKGSATVMVGGKSVLRVGDVSSCGAPIVKGSPNFVIGR